MNKATLPIKGMHCQSCVIRIEEELCSLKQITKVKVDLSKSLAVIYHEGSLNHAKIAQVLNKLGYEIGKNETTSFFSTNKKDYIDYVKIITIISLSYFILKESGLISFFSGENLTPSSLGAIFLIGLTAGLSTCMALVGGLVLSVSARFAQTNPQASSLEKFRPHLTFNTGRVLSYFILGGLLGTVGEIIQTSTPLLGIITMGVGLLMLVFAIQLSGLFPKISNFNFALPSNIGKSLGLNSKANQQYSDLSAGILGALTFFLPCGFTQTMQLFAVTSGGFLNGALIMSIFALGTLPGLLSVGSLASFLKGNKAQMFYKVSSVLIVFFAFINISRGINLSGLNRVLASSESNKSQIKQKFNRPQNNNEFSQKEQVITAVFNGGYNLKPNNFTVKNNKPVRFIVDAKVDGTGCMSAMMIPGLVNRPTYLEGGKKIEFKFIPTKTGEYKIACAMGVSWGSIFVE
jgi:sulfite exporter TauE/SafE/copper chaperone CopZ